VDFPEGFGRPLKTMGISLSDLTCECECQCCKHRDKDDVFIMPIADDIDYGMSGKGPHKGHKGYSSAGRGVWREPNPWDPSAAAAAILKIGTTNDKLGGSAPQSPIASHATFNQVRFPIPPEYIAKVDVQGSGSTPKAKHSGIPWDTKVQTPKVQEFQPVTAEVCDRFIRGAAHAPIQACRRS
jgi:hypothetical protein